MARSVRSCSGVGIVLEGLGVLLDLPNLDLRVEKLDDVVEEAKEAVSTFMVGFSEYILVEECV